MRHFGFGKRLNYRAGDTSGWISSNNSSRGRRKSINRRCSNVCNFEFGANQEEYYIMGNQNVENWNFEEDGEALVDIMSYKVNVGGHYK